MPRLRLRVVIFLFLILSALIYAPVLFGSRSFFATDITTQNLGYRYWAAESVRGGHLPAWCPYLFTGYPVIAESQAGVFYPAFILFLLFPIAVAYNVFIVLHYFLACVFLFVWLRSRHLSEAASLITSTGYFFSSLLINFHVYPNDLSALIWLPLICACSTHFQSRAKKGVILAAFLFCLQILAGHSQFVWNTILFGLLLDGFTLPLNPRAKFQHMLRFWFVAPLCGALLAAVQILPTVELYAQSQRAGMDYAYATTPSYQLRFLAQAFLPNSFGNLENLSYSVAGPPSLEEMMNAFIGIPNLFFAVLALLGKNTPKRFGILAIAAIGIFLSLGSNNPAYFLIHRLPFFSFYRYPSRYLILATFSFLLLSAYGLDALFRGIISKKQLWAAFGIVSLGVLVSWFASRLILERDVLANKIELLNHIRHWDLINVAVMLAVLALFATWLRRNSFALFGLSLVGGILFGYKLPPTVPRSELTAKPQTVALLQQQQEGRIDSNYDIYIEDNIYSRFAKLSDKYERMRELISGDLNLMWGIPSIRGIYHPLIPRYYYQNLRAGLSWTVPGAWVRLLGLKYFLTDQPLQGSLTSYPLHELVRQGDIRIYDSLLPAQRAWIVHQWRLPKNDSDMDFDPDQMAIVNSPTTALPAASPESIEHEDAVVSRSLDRTVEIRCNLDKQGLLVLRDIYYPGWKATVDGAPAEILRVDHLFRGVFLAPGKHGVVFRYPASIVKWGLLLSGLSITTLALLYHKR